MKLKGYILKFIDLIIKWVKSDYFYNSLILFVSLWSFIKIAFDVMTKDEITYYDKVIVDFVNNIASSHSTGFAIFITDFGSKILFLLLLVAIIGFFASRHLKEAAFILASTGGGYLLTYLLKDIFDRTRPVVGTPVLQETGYSFPSGHSSVSVCFYGALIYLTFRYVQDIRAKIAISIILGILILLIGLSRIYLGVHYPSDVLGGFSLGVFWLSICVFFYKKYAG